MSCTGLGTALAADLVDRVAAADPGALTRLAHLATMHLQVTRIAVRSSAVGEDSADASFAGQHVTKLNVTHATLADAVRLVWESARSESALQYRARRGLPTEQIGRAHV